MATVHDRYTVQDPDNGLLASFQTIREALEFAARQESEDTTIFDVMAHAGRPCEWTKHGLVLDWRRAVYRLLRKSC